MSPQKPDFNRGVWKKLEKEVRRYAYNEDSVFVITGPILERGLRKIGRANKVSVPRRFFKIVYDETPPRKMIAFVLPNEGSAQASVLFSILIPALNRRARARSGQNQACLAVTRKSIQTSEFAISKVDNVNF